MLTLDHVHSATADAPHDELMAGTALPRGIRLVQLNDDLWRVTRPEGEVLGYLERFIAIDGVRFRAKRLMVKERRFVAIGEFWAFSEGIDCFAW